MRQEERILDAYSAAVRRAVETAGPAVVSIRTERAGPMHHGLWQAGIGSGLVIDSSGLVATNAHVVAGAQRVEVGMPDGRRFPARVAATDRLRDLALLEAEIRGAEPGRLADSDQTVVGQLVIAIGNPLGLEHTVTTGVISARNRRIHTPRGPVGGLLQTDASINPGNSGGPLVDADGAVIGINTAVIAGAQGIGFAVPSNDVRALLDRYDASGSGERAWLGIAGAPQTLEDGRKGLLILQVAPGSPAERAGLRSLDVLLSVDGTAVSDQAGLMLHLSRLAAGARVEAEVERSGRLLTVWIHTAPAP